MNRLLDDDYFMTTRQAARYLGVGRWTLWHWKTINKVPYYIVSARSVRYKKSDLDNFLLKKRGDL